MTESLKIAFYTDTFLPAVDGAVISILNFRKELENRGHEVYIYASGNEKTRQMTKKDKNIVVVRGLRFRSYPQYNLALFPMASKLRTFNLKMDINHAHTPFMMGVHAVLLSKVVDKKPIVGSFHTLFTDRSVIKEYVVANKLVTDMIMRYSWRYARLFYNRCDKVVAPSTSIRNMLKKRGIKNVNVVPNGIEMDNFDRSTSGAVVRKRILKGKKGKVIMYVGRLSREKKLETMIKAARRLKKDDIKFAIVGSGPAEKHYRSMVEHMNLGEKIKFMGFVPNKRLPAYYAASDALCLPSTFETQGVVSLEAMAMGKPVIGADYLALKELIKNGKNGEKFKPNDSRDCARKIRKVIYNIDSYKEMTATARSYSIERATDSLLDLYKDLLNNDNL